MSYKTIDYYNKIGNSEPILGGDTKKIYYDGTNTYTTKYGIVPDPNVPRVVASDVAVELDDNKSVTSAVFLVCLILSVIFLIISSAVSLFDEGKFGSAQAVLSYIGGVIFIIGLFAHWS